MKSALLIPLTLNFGLTVAIVEYRQSRRHPLASYPGPRLARLTKWWMGYWISTGDRHLLLDRYVQLSQTLKLFTNGNILQIA
jgi:hypothetical protein